MTGIPHNPLRGIAGCDFHAESEIQRKSQFFAVSPRFPKRSSERAGRELERILKSKIVGSFPFGEMILIESLILAQDERWRRG